MHPHKHFIKELHHAIHQKYHRLPSLCIVIFPHSLCELNFPIIDESGLSVVTHSNVILLLLSREWIVSVATHLNKRR